MDVFAGEMMVNAVGMQVFAVKKEGAYRHFFSISSRTYVNVDKLRKWIKRKGKNKMYVFEYYALYDEVYELFTKIESEASLSFVYETSNIKIDFGHLVSRPLIFIPNVPGNSISNGWWPAAMNDGFACKQLIGDFEFEITLQAKTNALGFIKERVGVDLNFLEDYIGSAIFILNQEQQVNDVSFNQDMMQLLFTKRGGYQQTDREYLWKRLMGKKGWCPNYSI